MWSVRSTPDGPSRVPYEVPADMGHRRGTASRAARRLAAYLDARQEEWLGLYRARLEHADGPREGVLAVFDAYADHAAFAYEHGFRCCGLLNAAAELPAGDEGRAVVRAHKEEVEHLIAGHLEQLLPFVSGTVGSLDSGGSWRGRSAVLTPWVGV